MSITSNLDAYESINNFQRVYIGPVVYILYDGKAADTNIVYIGKSASEIIMRVSQHIQDKDFDKVGVVLPKRTDPIDIHNLEHFVIEEYVDRWGQLPRYNSNNAHFHPDGKHFNWHTMARRKEDSLFLGDSDTLKRASDSPGTYAKTVSELRRLFDRIYEQHADWTADDTWEEVSRRLRGAYTASTLKQYSYQLHGRRILSRLRK